MVRDLSELVQCGRDAFDDVVVEGILRRFDDSGEIVHIVRRRDYDFGQQRVVEYTRPVAGAPRVPRRVDAAPGGLRVPRQWAPCAARRQNAR